MKNENEEEIINKEQVFQTVFHIKNPIQQKKEEISQTKKTIKKITNASLAYPLNAFFWLASVGAMVTLITLFVMFLLGIRIESLETLIVSIIIWGCVYIFLKKWGITEY